jgi:hypothetical protein
MPESDLFRFMSGPLEGSSYGSNDCPSLYISWLGEQDLAVKEEFYSKELSVSLRQHNNGYFCAA